MKGSIKYSVVGLVGAGIFAGSVISNTHRLTEYRKSKNEMLHQMWAAEDKQHNLGQKVDDCIKTVHDCRSVYAQYKAASDEVSMLKNKYLLFENNPDNSSPWEPAIGISGLALVVAGFGVGIGSYLRERREKKEKLWNMK
ncbi:MAG: hypothetical protein AABX31_04295 [Nanoarchaeota archaeon]